MVVDLLENLEEYKDLNPLFPIAFSFLKSTDLSSLETGKIILKEDELIINISQTTPKSKEEAQLETHNKFIDIQIPISDVEIIGYTPAQCCIPVDSPYNEESDLTLFEGKQMDFITVNPGMFTIFFPHDGHAPGISEHGVKKIVIKVKA